MVKKHINVPTSSEAQEQETVIEFCDLKNIPIVHIPNEGKRSVSCAAALKRQGLRRGFPDLFVPLARGPYHGLFIEMKYAKNKPTQDQMSWLKRLAAQGYACVVCYSSREAIKAIEAYDRKK